MGSINGKDFIDRLNQMGTEIWYDGKKVEGNLCEHPAFKGLLHTKASLFAKRTEVKGRDDFLSPWERRSDWTFLLAAKNKRGFKEKKKNDGTLGAAHPWNDGKKS